MLFVSNKMEQGRAHVYQVTKAIRMKDVVQNASLAQIAHQTKHASEINAKTHALVFAACTLLVPW